MPLPVSRIQRRVIQWTVTGDCCSVSFFSQPFTRASSDAREFLPLFTNYCHVSSKIISFILHERLGFRASFLRDTDFDVRLYHLNKEVRIQTRTLEHDDITCV